MIQTTIRCDYCGKWVKTQQSIHRLNIDTRLGDVMVTLATSGARDICQECSDDILLHRIADAIEKRDR